jgi:hypothetical protein
LGLSGIGDWKTIALARGEGCPTEVTCVLNLKFLSLDPLLMRVLGVLCGLIVLDDGVSLVKWVACTPRDFASRVDVEGFAKPVTCE